MSLTVGTSGGNKEATEMWVGTSGGNKKVTEGWVGTASGNKQFIYPPVVVTITATSVWVPVYDSNPPFDILYYEATYTFSVSGGTGTYSTVTINTVSGGVDFSDASFDTASTGTAYFQSVNGSNYTFNLTVTDNLGNSGTSSNQTITL